MTLSLPLNVSDIAVKLCLKSSGTGIVACTDKVGRPYIGFYPLDWNGMPCGLPSRFQEQRMASLMLIGYTDDEPVTEFIRTEVTSCGLRVMLGSPLPLINQNPRHTEFSVSWGSGSPLYRYTPHF